MNYLILSSEFGDGYDSAAFSLAQAAEKAGIETVIADPAVFSSGSPKLYRKLFSRYKGFRVLRKYANKLYDRTNLEEHGFHSPSSQFFSNLNEYIAAEKFGAVICVGNDVINRITESDHTIDAPACAVMADFVCPSDKGLTRYDRVFVPHELIRAELIAKDYPESRITVSGIPVPPAFSGQMGRQAARNYLVIPQSRRVYLIHCRGLSTGNIEDICDSLIREESHDYAVYLLVGREESKRDDLLAYYGTSGRINVITYTEKVNVYMEAADVMLAKSVGIISAEGALSSVPIVHVSPVTGRDKNADFLASCEMSLKALGVRDTVKKAMRLAEKTVLTERMKIIQRINCPRDGADTVIRTVSEKMCGMLTAPKEGL